MSQKVFPVFTVVRRSGGKEMFVREPSDRGEYNPPHGLRRRYRREPAPLFINAPLRPPEGAVHSG